jgi:4-aminobutyrate aminotransferase
MSIQDSIKITDRYYYDVSDTKMVKGHGVYLYDDKDNQYIDCISGTFNLSLGHNHPEVLKVVKEQLDSLIFASSTYQTEPINSLIDSLLKIVPKNLTAIHPHNSGGSTTNEGAIKVAQYVTGKRDVITMFRGHYGQTLATSSLSGYASRRKPFPYLMGGAVCVPSPYCYRCFYDKEPQSCDCSCVSKIADFIKYASSGSVACIIIEPIFGVGGNITPPKKYFQKLKDFCMEYNILLIFDEVQTGFGRTGYFFAADYYEVNPNMMTFAKGISGIGLPIGVLATEESLKGLPKEHHGFTNGNNPIAATAAVKTIEIMSRPGFLQNVRNVGELLKSGLQSMMEDYEFIGDVRGVGLMLGIEIISSNGEPDYIKTKELFKAMTMRKLLVRIAEHGVGNVIELRPPLILNKDQAQEIIKRFEEACNEIK